jgi:two-component system sensor histidine kinase PilS (NtrC family)
MAVAVLFLGITLFYGDALNLGSHQLGLFRGVCLAYLMLAAVFHSVLRNLRDLFNVQLSAHLALDIVAITLLMYASGGIRSGLGVMLLIAITGAALVAHGAQRCCTRRSPRRILLEQTYWMLRFDAPSELPAGAAGDRRFRGAGMVRRLAQRVAETEPGARAGARWRRSARQPAVIADIRDSVLVLDRKGAGRAAQPAGAAPARLRCVAGRNRAAGAGFAGSAPGAGDARAARLESTCRAAGAPAPDGNRRRGAARGGVRGDTTRSREGRSSSSSRRSVADREYRAQIRNPLSAISHAAGTRRGLRERERGASHRIIHDNTLRLERLVSNVLQLNRRDRAAADRLPLESWLPAFVEDFCANESVPADRIAVDAGHLATVIFDRERLRQVLWNLLRNGLQHARAEPGSVRLLVNAFADQVELNVIDNGPGVARATLGQLFEPFFHHRRGHRPRPLSRARTVRRERRGAGYVDDMQGAHFRITSRRAPPP